MHLEHFFVYVFEGEIYGKLKNIHLRKPTLILKKSFFWFVYIRLHSSTFVYICLNSSSDCSTLIYIRLDLSGDSSTLVYIPLHRSTFVYTRLHSSSDSSVFLELICFLEFILPKIWLTINGRFYWIAGLAFWSHLRIFYWNLIMNFQLFSDCLVALSTISPGKNTD